MGDAHPAHLLEAFPHPLLDDVLEADHPQAACGLANHQLGDHQRGAAAGGDAVHDGADLVGGVPAVVADPLHRCGGRALADLSSVEVDSAHSRLGGERHEAGVVQLAGGSFSEAVGRLGQYHDGTPLGGLVGQAGELCGVRELAVFDTVHREELGGLAVAKGDFMTG